MRQAARLIIWAFGQQNMSVDPERPVVDCMPACDSGSRVCRAMEKSDVIYAVGKLPEPQESWVCLAYTDDFTPRDEGVVVGHVMANAARFGAAGQIAVADLACTVEAISMMVDNAIGKTINGKERHARKAIADVLGIDIRNFVPCRFHGRLESAVNKITQELDRDALDAVEAALAKKAEKVQAA